MADNKPGPETQAPRLKSCRSDIDWSKKRYPWSEHGRQIRDSVAAIIKGMLPDQPPLRMPAYLRWHK